MTVEKADETAGFVTTESDYPEVQAEPAAEAEKEPDGSNDVEAEGKGGEVEAEKSQADSEGEDGQNVGDDQTDVEHGNDSAAKQGDSKKKNRVQKRIDKVVRERESIKREKEALEKKIQELEGKKVSESKEPKESDFDTYDQYLDALESHEGEQEKAQNQEPTQESKQKDDSKGDDIPDSTKTAFAVISEAVKDSETKPDDFEAVTGNPDLDITGEMIEAIAECDNKTEVLYALGKDPKLTSKIALGTPAQQMREIAKMDLAGGYKPPKPPKISNAPDPISPGRANGSVEKTPAQMSQAEYEEWANKQEQNRDAW